LLLLRAIVNQRAAVFIDPIAYSDGVPTDLNSRRSEATLALAMMPEVIHIVNWR